MLNNYFPISSFAIVGKVMHISDPRKTKFKSAFRYLDWVDTNGDNIRVWLVKEQTKYISEIKGR